MDQTWAVEIDAILGVGRSLESLGVHNWGLDRHLALAAVNQLAALGVGILGGDVYLFSSSNLAPNYDNWYCNRQVNEPAHAFAERSAAVATRYLCEYQPEAGTFLFAIVPEVTA